MILAQIQNEASLRESRIIGYSQVSRKCTRYRRGTQSGHPIPTTQTAVREMLRAVWHGYYGQLTCVTLMTLPALRNQHHKTE